MIVTNTIYSRNTYTHTTQAYAVTKIIHISHTKCSVVGFDEKNGIEIFANFDLAIRKRNSQLKK